MAKSLHHHFKKHDSGWLWPLIGILAIVLLIWWAFGNQPVGMMPPPPGVATTVQQPSGSTTKKASGTAAAPKATDVVSIAEGVSNATTFASWLRSTGVAAELSGTGTYTIFVPTNDVIAQLPTGTFRNLSAAEQKRFVEFHIIAGKVINADAQVAGTVQTLSGDPLNFTRRPGQTALVGSGAILAQYKASNGIVYIVNTALIPPQRLQ